MTVAADRLRQHAERAEPPLRIAGIPSGVISASDWDVTEPVLELFTPLAILCADMAGALYHVEHVYLGMADHNMRADISALLARLDKLTAAAGPV